MDTYQSDQTNVTLPVCDDEGDHCGGKKTLLAASKLSSASFNLPKTDTMRKYQRLAENLAVHRRDPRSAADHAAASDATSDTTGVADRTVNEDKDCFHKIPPFVDQERNTLPEMIEIPNSVPSRKVNNYNYNYNNNNNNETFTKPRLEDETAIRLNTCATKDHSAVLITNHHRGEKNACPSQTQSNGAIYRDAPDKPGSCSTLKSFDHFLNQCNGGSKKCVDIIPTVAFAIPMFYAGLNFEQATTTTPREATENRRNIRRSSKMLNASAESQKNRDAKLKKHGLSRWKLSFIQKSVSKRKVLAMLCLGMSITIMILLLGIAVLVYTSSSMGWISAVMNSEEIIKSDENVVTGIFRISNYPFTESLNDTKSTQYQRLASRITRQLDSLFSASISLGHDYNHSEISGLVGEVPPSGVRVDCRLVLASLPTLGDSANLVGIEFLRGLRHRNGKMWLGDFVVDMQSISFYALSELTRDGMDITFFPNWSPWSDWSSCEAAVPNVVLTTSRSRLCRLNNGTGEILSDIEPCLLMEGGGDLEIEDCSTRSFVEATGVFDALNGNESRATNSSADVNSTEMEPPMEIRLRPNGTDKPQARRCNECNATEVCIALTKEDVPICRSLRDPHDPTGCGGHCRLGVEFCRKIDVDAYRCLDDNSCFENEFQCANLLCIPSVKRCDGHKNCYDETDEYDCECDLSTHFHCLNNTSCLPNAKKCDRVIDCWDGSDEANCTRACPSTNQFTCTSGQCIPRMYFCDGLPDCSDGTDEPFGCGGVTCFKYEWKCKNGRCVPKDSICDGRQNCGDYSDEENCEGRHVKG